MGAIQTKAMERRLYGDNQLEQRQLKRRLTTQYGNGGDIAIYGQVTGMGALTKIGEGVLVLTGNNTYAGGTTVNVGTLLATVASRYQVMERQARSLSPQGQSLPCGTGDGTTG